MAAKGLYFSSYLFYVGVIYVIVTFDCTSTQKVVRLIIY